MVSKADIIAAVDPAIIATKDEAAIAAAYSMTMPKKLVATEIGIGTILDTLDLEDGNAFLDVIFTQPEYRYLKIVIEQGKLDVSLPSVRSRIDSVLPAAAAAKFKALAEKEDSISAYDVAIAFERG